LHHDVELDEAALPVSSVRRGAIGSGGATVRLRRRQTVVFTEKKRT
jgi:hypothetical protein